MIFEKKSVMVGGDIVKTYIEILKQAGCFEFLRRMVEKDTEKFLRLPIISEGAAKSIQTNLQTRLENLYRQPLMRTLRLTVEEFDVVEAMTPTGQSVEALRRAADKIFNELIQDTGEPFKEKFFILRDYETTIRKNFLDFIQEFLDRVQATSQQLPIKKILSLSSDGADTHRHGRTVLRMETDAGTFYYKPHDCAVDVLYHKIISNWFSDCTQAAEIISGDCYGFASELVAGDIETAEDVATYFYNFGKLTALFHGLGTVDMHHENILGCGVYPCAVDLETLFKAEEKSARNIKNFSTSDLDFTYSVARTCIMPDRVHLGNMFSPLYGRHTVEGYEEKFLSGFSEGYERVLTHRAEILSLIENYKGATLRIVPRNSNYYAQLLGILHRAENLSSLENRQQFLDKLPSYGKNFSEAVINHEQKSLLEGEIPYFCVQLDGTALCGDDETDILQENYFEESALASVKFRLDRLSQAEKIFEEQYISRRLKHAPLDEKSLKVELPTFSEINFDFDVKDCAIKIFEELKNDAIYTTDGTITWYSWLLADRKQPSLRLMTPQANAAQYCGKILKCQALASYHEQARALTDKCLAAIAAQIALFEKTDAETLQKLPVGIYDGLGGIILACIELGEEKILQRVLKLIGDKKIYGEKFKDIADGTAGLILALSHLGNNFQLSAFDVQELFNTTDGAALAFAYKLTGDKKFLDAAIKSFEKICEAYSEDLNGWADDDEVIAWLATRAPKSAGIGLSAMYAAEFADAEIFDEVLKLALHSVESEENLWWNDSLDNGNALSVLFLARAAKKFNRPDLFERAKKILAAMNQRKEKVGHYRLTEKGVRTFFEASMFVGSLGIGYAALELESFK